MSVGGEGGGTADGQRGVEVGGSGGAKPTKPGASEPKPKLQAQP